MKHSVTVIRWACSFLLCSPGVFAGDFYVDVVNGDNTNSGSSAAQAWKNISYGAGFLGGNDTLHIAPGLYSVAAGESFPIPIGGGARLLAANGPQQTILDGNGAGLLIDFRGSPFGVAVVDGLWLRNGVRGTNCSPPFDDSFNFALENVLITSMSELAVNVESSSFLDFSAQVDATITTSTIRDCGRGISASGSAIPDSSASFSLTCSNSLLADNDWGIMASVPSHGLVNGSLFISGCRFMGHANSGVGIGGIGASIASSTFGHNGVGVGSSWDAFLSLNGCTITANTLGLETGGGSVTAKNSILFGSATNVAGAGFQPTYCDLGGGPFVGMNGNISVDPEFWAPEVRDYNLKSTSPLIDAGTPSNVDIGAFQFDPNYAPEPANYCEGGVNSVLQQSEIGALGGPSIATNDFALMTWNNPPGQFGIFFYGGGQTDALFGAGTLCVEAGGTGVFRLAPPLVTDSNGNATRLVDFTSAPAGAGPGAIRPSTSRHFQFWYRDPNGPGTFEFNLSNGLTAWFLP